jgi:uncharacterized damage-inducible protein DinB
MNISPLVKEAWRINDGMNQVILEYLTPEMLSVTTPDKNWSVAGYLAHLAGSKKWWASHVNKDVADGLPDLYQETEGKFIVEKNMERIKAVFEQTSQTLLETAERAENKGTLPYASLDLYLLHMIIHDAHHRGQIFLTLRAAGHTPPDEDTFWGGWWPEQNA